MSRKVLLTILLIVSAGVLTMLIVLLLPPEKQWMTNPLVASVIVAFCVAAKELREG